MVPSRHFAGVQGTTIHSALTREHGFTGSYSAVRRLLQQLNAAKPPEVSMRLTFQPGDAVQVDFGSSPLLTDVHTGEIFKTWFFVMTLCWSRHQYVDLYSVPFKLVSLSLWLKATETTLQLYREHELVATHVRQTKQGSRSTVADHMPPEAQAWQTQDTQWYLQEAARIGPSCHALIHALFSDKVLENLRAVQAVLRLAKKFGSARLNAACARAMAFDQPRLSISAQIPESETLLCWRQRSLSCFH